MDIFGGRGSKKPEGIGVPIHPTAEVSSLGQGKRVLRIRRHIEERGGPTYLTGLKKKRSCFIGGS